MDTLQCAIVLAKLERFALELEKRIEVGQRYNALTDEIGIERVQQRSDRTSVFGQYTIFVDKREELQERLKEAGIPTVVHYPIPLNAQPVYKHLCCPDCTPLAAQVAKRVLSLPMYSDLPHLEQIKIVSMDFLYHKL